MFPIGKKRAVALGYQVFAGVRQASKIKHQTDAFSQSVAPVEIDITVPSSVQSSADYVAKSVGDAELIGLINNAGCIIQGPLELLSIDEIKEQFDINVFGNPGHSGFSPFASEEQGKNH